MFKAVLFTLFAAIPTSETYTMPSYDFGNGSGSGSSTNYQLRSAVGSPAGNEVGGTYKLPAGIRSSTTVATPAAPIFTNPDSSYDRLKLTLTTTGFASDVKYAIAISADDFATTKYVQPDQTIGTPFSIANYQTYAAWGGASGAWVIGLQSSTTYKVKVAALQGASTGSSFGPTASAATVAPSVTFGLSTSLTSTPPFIATFSSLLAGTVTGADATISTVLTTNAKSGTLLIRDQNAGLTSASKSYTLTSATADLAVATAGYGAQITTTSQSSGGPLVGISPYTGTVSNVGALTATIQQLASFASPITNGSLTVALKAKASAIVPAATDYVDVVTLTANLSF